ncbi:MAG: SPOR domain-containing protein [Ignavibacteriales bacterium]|nr:SPOR domain-containing protein [Ignavibacteriales bacterium]MBI3788924.1 SPOR domain-containing protein [Ignavibacteriales bacterium]
MPDLNLSEDESAENIESTEPSSEQTDEQPQEEKKGGGAVKVLIVVLAILIVGGGAAFLLNRLGIVKLWGKKQSAATVVEYNEMAPPQEQAVEKKDTAPTQMIETPAIDAPKKAPAKAEAKPESKAVAKGEKKPAPPVKEMPTAQSSGKLTEMKGEYTIQVFALKNKTSAESMVQKLGDAGYPVYLEEREYKDGPWYTVRIGHYPSRKDAQMAVESFAEELKSRYWIDRVKK